MRICLLIVLFSIHIHVWIRHDFFDFIQVTYKDSFNQLFFSETNLLRIYISFGSKIGFILKNKIELLKDNLPFFSGMTLLSITTAKMIEKTVKIITITIQRNKAKILYTFAITI